MKSPCKRLLSLLLCLLMVVTCIPVAGAEGDASPRAYEANELYTEKRTNLQEDGTYTIDLETFITGTVTERPTPMDIVLVMDQSASMVNNVMTEMPDSIRYPTAASEWTYTRLQSLPMLIYLPGDGYYYEAKVERTSNGTVKGIITLGGTEYLTSNYSKTLTMSDGSNFTLTAYHCPSEQKNFKLASRFEWSSFSNKYYYYNVANTNEKTSEFSTEKGAYDYLITTYLKQNYSDHIALNLQYNDGSPYMAEVCFCVPVYEFYWQNTQYTISYYSQSEQKWLVGEVDTCNGWRTATPEFPTTESNITARCNSSKLYYFTRTDALQTAAHDFILNIQKLAKEQGVDHRVAVAGFSGGALADGEAAETVTVDYYGTELLSTAEKVSYTNATTADYLDALQPALNADGSDNQRLLDAIGLIDGYSTTYLNYGLEMAKRILNERTDKSYFVGSKELPRKTVVIVFTDGVPGNYDKLGEFADYTAVGPITVANRSLAKAKELKDAGAEVYCIGMLEGVDPTASYNFKVEERSIGENSQGDPVYKTCYVEEKDAINAFLHFLSSDYPTAGDMLTPDRSIVVNNNYFYAATNSTSLYEAFKNLSAAIADTTVTLDDTAVVKDILSEYFELPEDIEDNPTKYVKTYTEDYIGNGNWSNRTEITLNIKVDRATRVVDVSGFNFKENYVHEAQGSLLAGGKKLIVEIHAIIANPFAPQNATIYTNDPASGVYAGGQLDSPFKAFDLPTEHLQVKGYVLDYFASAEIDPREVGVYTPLHLSKDGMTLFNTDSPSTSTNCANGTVELKDGILYYTPTNADFHEVDDFYLFGKDANGENVWARISILPANNVFYEDDWATYSGAWAIEGATGTNSETFNNEVHGYIDSKVGENGYSNGSAHFSEKEGDFAEFTFTGTGIDVYCRTDKNCGVALALLTPDGEEVATKYFMVDNESASGTYYQIPTVFFHGLDHGTYTLKVMVATATENGARNDYYLDGFRVYNPLQAEDELVTEAYGNEAGSEYTTVRQLLINSVPSEGSFEGAVFIDQIKDANTGIGSSTTSNAIQSYISYGPKNEVYLAPGNSIVLNVDPAAHYFMGIKSPSGSANVTFSYGEGATREVTVNSAADLYYEIIPNANGFIEIKNTSEEGIIALTKLRVCGAEKGLSLRSVTADEILDYADSFDALEQAELPTLGASSLTKAPKQPKSIFRNINKPIVGREQK